MSSDGRLLLAEGLEPGWEHTRADWEAAAAAVLRKAGRLGDDDPDDLVWQRLTRRTLDGIGVPPLGTPDLLQGLATAGRPLRQGAWDVRSLVIGDDPAVVARTALEDLEAGATSLLLQVADGLDLGPALDGVLLDVAPVTLHRPSLAQSEQLADLLAAYDRTPAAGTNLSADPLTTDDPPEAMVRVARRALELGVLGVVVDGAALHEQGASDVQELGWSIAVGVHYLRVLTGAGLDLDDAAGLLEFRYAVTDDQFPQIAKLRAARRLWARVLEASGGSDVPQRQHAVTSRAMATRRDPWVNMLRTTVAAFAAGVGGADAITVVPFDATLGRPDAFGRRIARNTSALLVEESHVAAVTDPAGGAYAVEKLTDDLAVAAWAELGRLESDGGAASDAAREGIHERVREVARRRDEEVATRRRPITGVSEFPNLEEKLPEREPYRGDDVPVRRWDHDFEDLRAEPATTPVLLATMGPLASYTARASFAANLFAAGGVDTVPAGPTDGVEAVLAAYDGQPVVCLVGHDRSYDEWGAELVSALREAGAAWVVVAGKPADLGVDDACALGVDALAFLRRTKEHLA